MERLMQVIGTKFLLLTTQYSYINDCEWFRTINLYQPLEQNNLFMGVWIVNHIGYFQQRSDSCKLPRNLKFLGPHYS